jgi:hypothetical protein
MNALRQFKLFIAVCALVLAVSPAFTDILPRNAVWSYSDTGTDLGAAWFAPDYNDGSWKKGAAPLGFGDDFSETDPKLPLATAVSFGDPANKWMCTYFRTTVDVSAADLAANSFEVYIHVDDGAAVYINGKEAFRRGIADGAVSFATSAKFKPKEETFSISPSVFKAGKNVIAVEVHQDGGDSSDLWFELGIRVPESKAAAETPKASVPDANAPRGIVSKVTVSFNADPVTGRAFTWYTTRAAAGSDLQVAKKTGKTADFSKATKFSGTFGLSTSAPDQVWHKAEATGLSAGTAYWYRVGDAKLDLWGEAGSFTTAKKSGAFSFINLADTQAKSEDEAVLSAATISKAVAAVPNAAFLTLNGDIVDTGSNEEQWGWVLGHSASVLNNFTIAPAAGNHEEDPHSFIEHFNVPVPAGADTKSGAYYSWNYQGAHFIVLNNNEDSPEWADFTPAQIDWLKADVAAARKSGTNWIIVSMHKGPYTTSNHATDIDMTAENGVRTKFAPLVAELGIDLVLQGHDHIYARTKPIASGKVVAKGPVYLIPGTAGPKVYYRNKKIDPSYYDLFAVADENHAAAYGPDPKDASRPVRSQIQNFVGVTIAGKKLTAKVWEIDQSKDGGKPFVIDTFSITK